MTPAQSAAADQLREAYLAEAFAMVLILAVGLFWLASLIADWWVAYRAAKDGTQAEDDAP